MTYTETKTTGYGTRLKNSLKGIITGIALFIAATCLLFCNEGRSVKTADTIKEVALNTELVDDVSKVSEELNGKLIHASARANTADVLTDSLFDISANAIKLNRKVSFYQYSERCEDEEHEKFGGSVETVTTCKYKKVWEEDEPIDSSEFKDPKYTNKNVVLLTIENEEHLAENVSFGAYRLPKFLIKKISNEQNVEIKLSEEIIKAWQTQLLEMYYTLHPERKVIKKPVLKEKEIKDEAKAKEESKEEDKEKKENKEKEIKLEEPQEPELIHINLNSIYIGQNPAKPEIGDVKITFEKTMPTDVSIIAKVKNDTFAQYLSKNKKTFSRLETGDIPFDVMIAHAESENTILTWLVRLGGIILLYIGIGLIFNIIPMLFKWFPFLGNIVEAGTGIVCGLGALIWGLLVIAVAWFFYRPIMSIVLIALAVGGILLLKKKANKNLALQKSNDAEN